MNIKRVGIATLAAFVFVFIFEMLWHGFLMRGMYEATSSVWRPEDPAYMPYMIGSHVLFALFMTLFWVKVGKFGPCKKGIAFGVFAGLILGGPQLGTHAWLPVPLTISLLWMLSAFLKGLGTGLVVAKLYKD